MKQIIKIISAVIAVFFSVQTSSAQMENPLGEEDPTRHVVKLGLFNSVKVLDNIAVNIKCNPDSTGYAVYSTSAELANAPLFTVNKGEVKVQVITELVDHPNLPVVTLYTDYLTSVENSNLSCLNVEMSASVPDFKAVLMGNGSIVVSNIHATGVNASIISGNGTISLNGECEKGTYRMLGTGLIQADELKATEVNCKILGSGSIGCWATKMLDIRGIGSTKIYYRGDPKIKKVGGGKYYSISEMPAQGESESDTDEE